MENLFVLPLGTAGSYDAPRTGVESSHPVITIIYGRLAGFLDKEDAADNLR